MTDTLLGFGLAFTLQDQFSNVAKNIRNEFAEFTSDAESFKASINASMAGIQTGLGLMGTGVAILAPLNMAIDKAVEYSDIYADVMKTTSMSLEQVQELAGEFQKIDTRTNLSGLLDIAKIGGSIGIVEEELFGFTKAIDMVGVALGDEFKGGTEEITKQLGTVKNLFKETKGLASDDALLKIGSMANQLGAEGTATAGNITDFALRMGQLSELAPNLVDTFALGATFEQLGIKSENAASGLSSVLSVAGTSGSKFAKQIGLTNEAFTKMYSEDPAEFLKQLAISLQGLNDVEVSTKLKSLGINDLEAKKVFMSFKDNITMFETAQLKAMGQFQNATSLQDEFETKNKTLAASLQKITNEFENITLGIGEALAPNLHVLSDSFLGVLDSVNGFIKTDFGQTIVRATASIGVGIAGLGTAIAGFHAVKLGATLATPAINFFTSAMSASLVPMLPYIAIGGAVAGVTYGLVKAYDSFTEVLGENGKVADGFLGFMQKTGGLIHSTIEMFQSATNEGFTMSNNVYNALESMGIADTAVSIGTWIVRVKAFFGGVSERFDNLMNVFASTGEAIGRMFEAFNPVFDLLGRMGLGIERNTSEVSNFGVIGGRVFDAITLPIRAVAMGLEVTANVLTFAIDTVGHFGNAFVNVYEEIDATVQMWKEGWISFPEMFYNIGGSIVENLKMGFLNAWESLNTLVYNTISALPSGEAVLKNMGWENPNEKQQIQNANAMIQGEFVTDNSQMMQAVQMMGVKPLSFADAYKQMNSYQGQGMALNEASAQIQGNDSYKLNTYVGNRVALNDSEKLMQIQQMQKPNEPIVVHNTTEKIVSPVFNIDGQTFVGIVNDANELEGNRR